MKRLLVIGAGGIAHRHVAALQKIRAVRISGVCDIDGKRAAALAAKAEAPAFSDAAEAIEATQPDYVDIARYLCGAEAEAVSAVGVNQVLPRSDKVSTVDAACWTLRMANGVLVNHSHTWGACGWDCRLHLVTDRSRVTVDMFSNRAEGTVDGRDFRYDGSTNEFELEHRGFLEALTSGEQGLIRSPFADALKSFRLAAEINRLIYGYTSELDVTVDDDGEGERGEPT